MRSHNEIFLLSLHSKVYQRSVSASFTPNKAKYGIAVARFNGFVVESLVAGAIDALVRHGVDEKDIERVVYGGSNISTEGFTPEQMAESSGVYFAYLKSELLPQSKEKLDILALTLIENPSLKLTVYGHITKDEDLAARGDEIHLDLASRRIKNVINYLKSHGIDESRFESEIMNAKDPESTEPTLVGKARNRRVVFKKN